VQGDVSPPAGTHGVWGSYCLRQPFSGPVSALKSSGLGLLKRMWGTALLWGWGAWQLSQAHG